MRELTWSLIFSFLLLIFAAFLIQDFQIESLPQVFVAGIILGILNFIIAPMLLGLGVRPGIFNLGLVAFALNFLILNIATGLIDEFGKNSWETALFGAVIMAFFQVFLDRRDPKRRKLMG